MEEVFWNGRKGASAVGVGAVAELIRIALQNKCARYQPTTINYEIKQTYFNGTPNKLHSFNFRDATDAMTLEEYSI